MATTASEFDELKSDLAIAMKSSWFDIGVEHWQWPQRPGKSMNCHLVVAMNPANGVVDPELPCFRKLAVDTARCPLASAMAPATFLGKAITFLGIKADGRRL